MRAALFLSDGPATGVIAPSPSGQVVEGAAVDVAVDAVAHPAAADATTTGPAAATGAPAVTGAAVHGPTSGVAANEAASDMEATRGSRRARADELYRKYGSVVFRCCARLLRDPEEAKDATQDVFIKLLRNVDALEQDEHAVAWVYRVATNHCLNLRRDGARERPLEPDVEVAGDAQASYPDIHLARSILTRFDAQTRAIAVGVIVEEMDHEEVASSLGVSKRTVTRKLKRFFQHSRKFVARTDSGDGDAEEL